MLSQDTTIQLQHHTHSVLAHRQVISWPNDSATIGLHRVQIDGRDDMFLRACRHGALLWFVFDLRHVTPASFEGEIKTLLPRDADGMVYFTLRLNHRNAAEFLARAKKHAKVEWHQAPAVAGAVARQSVAA